MFVRGLSNAQLLHTVLEILRLHTVLEILRQKPTVNCLSGLVYWEQHASATSQVNGKGSGEAWLKPLGIRGSLYKQHSGT